MKEVSNQFDLITTLSFYPLLQMTEIPQDVDSDSRGIKRVRQACSNCRWATKMTIHVFGSLNHNICNRKKKVRCSGERPSCSFCTRLNQECHYLRENWEGDRGSYAGGPVNFFDVCAFHSGAVATEEDVPSNDSTIGWLAGKSRKPRSKTLRVGSAQQVRSRWVHWFSIETKLELIAIFQPW